MLARLAPAKGLPCVPWPPQATLGAMDTDPFGIIGSVIDGRYRIDALVGEGGFGVVYRGFHLGFEHPIAVKCLKVPAHFTAEARQLFLERFRDEGRILARMGEHPSIVRVFDVGISRAPTDGALPYLVLEWLEGTDLEARPGSAAGRYSESQALELLRPAIDAIAMVHDNGIAHRDLKPANLFLAQTMRGTKLKVLDFGIAKAMQEGEASTQAATRTTSGFSAFSPQYGAPEQFHSKRFGPTGPWTDVYALGLILVELVMGHPLQSSDSTADCLMAALSSNRPTPRALGVTVSDAFEALCAKAVALSPADRFQNARQMLVRVDEILSLGAQPTTFGVAPTQIGDSPAPPVPSPARAGVATELGPQRASPQAAGVPTVLGPAPAPPMAGVPTVLGPALAPMPAAPTVLGPAPAPPMAGVPTVLGPAQALGPLAAAPWPASPMPNALPAQRPAKRSTAARLGIWIGVTAILAALAVGVVLVARRTIDETETTGAGAAAPCRPGRHLDPDRGCVPDEQPPTETPPPTPPTEIVPGGPPTEHVPGRPPTEVAPPVPPPVPPPCPPGQVPEPNGRCVPAPPRDDQTASAAKAFYDARGEYAGQYAMSRVERVRLVRVQADRYDAHVRYGFRCLLPVCCCGTNGVDQRVFRLAFRGGQWITESMGGHMSASL